MKLKYHASFLLFFMHNMFHMYKGTSWQERGAVHLIPIGMSTVEKHTEQKLIASQSKMFR